MTKRKAKTYEAEHNGRKVRVTVPPNTEAEDALADALKDNLGPEGCRIIARCIRRYMTTVPDNTKSSGIREARWFGSMMAELANE